MAKKIFGVYLAKLDAPNSEAHARLELPASPWELHDAMDKVQLQENEELYPSHGEHRKGTRRVRCELRQA